jgi:hypothetical protein
MIRDLDNMLRQLLVDGIPEITAADQVSFRPPDDDWRNEVINLGRLALNLYLVDVRENRKLRSNAAVRVGEVNGQVIYEPAPTRVDCHYLVTAWSPAQPAGGIEPTLDEHHLLYQTMVVLVNSEPLNPRRVYGETNSILGTLPPLFISDLPFQVLPVEGFLKQPEFWGTMGQVHHWRPAIYLIVTVPLALVIPPAGPMVTTTATTLRRTDQPGAPDPLYTIGGRVLDARTPPTRALANAWVQLSEPGGRRLGVVYTDDPGGFIFESLLASQYELAWRAQGLPLPTPRTITIPSPSGEYDLVFE